MHVDQFPYPPLIPLRCANYHRELVERPFRADLRPLALLQPAGPSFAVGPDGWSVAWEKFSFRLGFTPREGVVLHEVCVEDRDGAGPPRRRPVLYRASIVEMAVPYGDPRPPHNRKRGARAPPTSLSAPHASRQTEPARGGPNPAGRCALDAGDYGLGFAANSLHLGCDCLGAVRYFDAVVNNSAGEAVVIKNAVCMHEEDAGLLWKHVDYRNGYSESRRARRLVVSFIMTAVNYEYAFYWRALFSQTRNPETLKPQNPKASNPKPRYFNLDSTIGHEIKLTGLLSTSLPSPGEDPHNPTHGILVERGVVALHHQHFFCARLDFAVDDDATGGAGLVVCEVEAAQDGDGSAPGSNGFHAAETELRSTRAAARVACPELGRFWTVKNPASLHPVTGHPVAYAIVPGTHTARMMAGPASAVAARAPFVTKNLWVTPHHDRQARGGAGAARSQAVGVLLAYFQTSAATGLLRLPRFPLVVFPLQRFPAGEYVMQSAACSGLSVWTADDATLEGADPVAWYCFGVTHLVRRRRSPRRRRCGCCRRRRGP